MKRQHISVGTSQKIFALKEQLKEKKLCSLTNPLGDQKYHNENMYCMQYFDETDSTAPGK